MSSLDTALLSLVAIQGVTITILALDRRKLLVLVQTLQSHVTSLESQVKELRSELITRLELMQRDLDERTGGP